MRDVGRSREEIVIHEPKASDFKQASQVLLYYPNWFIEPINHRNVCYSAFCYIFRVVYWYNNQ